MATRPRFGAAAPADAARQRRHPASLTDQLQHAQGDLDVLLRDAHAGYRSADAFNNAESEAQRIAAAIVAAFRGSAERRPVNPVLARTATGVWL